MAAANSIVFLGETCTHLSLEFSSERGFTTTASDSSRCTTALAVSRCRGHWTVAAIDHFRPSLSEYLLRMRFYGFFSRLLPSRQVLGIHVDVTFL